MEFMKRLNQNSSCGRQLSCKGHLFCTDGSVKGFVHFFTSSEVILETSSFLQVTDMMLQDQHYPDWGKAARRFWKQGNNRIVLFWYTWSSIHCVDLSVRTLCKYLLKCQNQGLYASCVPTGTCRCVCAHISVHAYVGSAALCRVICSQ